MVPIATFDLETRSMLDLTKVGAWAYSEHETTDVICACWGIDRQPIKAWWPGCPKEVVEHLFEHIANGGLVEAHNVAFERSLWANVLTPRYGWPVVPDEQWRDTMAVACYYALPASLDRLAKALGFEGKDPDGARLINKYSKLYLKTAKKEISNHDFKKWLDYCRQDVRIEQSISDYLGELPDEELSVFLLDQKINMRGLYLDQDGIDTATAVVEARAAALSSEFKGITGLNPTQGEKYKVWLAEQGSPVEDLTADTIEEILEENELGQGGVRRSLEIRLKINKASTKKLDAMSRQRGKDGRARFQTRYHGAVTGRPTGSGFQPLNLNRGYDEERKITPEQLVRDIGHSDPELLDILYGDATDAVARASRHWVQAQKGNRILSGDFSSVEAVILACLAGEAWKIEAFRSGAKIYNLMADKIYNLPPGTVQGKTDPRRQDGKTGELAFGYQGALGAWLKFDNSGRHSDERILEICRAWRGEHPETKALWYGLEREAIRAVRHPGTETSYRQIGFKVTDEWLTMILPDGKRLWYYEPRLTMGMPAWHQPKQKEECKDGSCGHEPVQKLSYMSQKEGQWKRVFTYGGKLTENAVQATSRQILVPAMRRVEEAGYPIILTVYDEIVAEAPIGFGSLDEFAELMSGPLPEFAKDWPITLGPPWEGDRYRK